MVEKQEIVPKVETETLPDIDWRNKDGIALVKSVVAKDCTEIEFKYLYYMAAKYDLDPLKKEIWAVKYTGRPVLVFASRAGWLKIAHDSGKFDGIETTVEYEKKSENAKISYMPKPPKPYSATCTIYKAGCSHPFKETVLFSEYDQKHALWVSKPTTMIRKVAEVQCLRKAFSVSGLYAPDEMPPVNGESEDDGNKTV